MPGARIEREIAPLGRGKPTKIPVKGLPGWAKMACKSYFSVSVAFFEVPIMQLCASWFIWG